MAAVRDRIAPDRRSHLDELSSRTGLNVESVDDPKAIKALKPEWDELDERTTESTGFQSFQWCDAWLDAAHNTLSVRPRIVVVREGRRLVMLWPLQIERIFGLRWARCIGQPITQYGDALAEPSPERAVWFSLAEREVRGWRDVDLVYMPQVRRDSVLADAHVTLGRTQELRAPFLVLHDVDIHRQSSAVSRSLRRRESRLAQVGRVVLESLANPDEKRTSTAYILDLKEKWLRKKGFPRTNFVHPVSRRFLEHLAGNGFLEVHLLRAGTSVVAGDLGFVGGKGYRSLVSTYDSRFAYGSPGHVLTRLLIQDCRTRNLYFIDLLPPADDNKMRVANEAVDIGFFCIPVTRRGKIGAFAVANLRRCLQFARSWSGKFP